MCRITARPERVEPDEPTRRRRCASATPRSRGAATSTQAIDDIAAVGLPRHPAAAAKAFAQFGDRPGGAARRCSAQHRLDLRRAVERQPVDRSRRASARSWRRTRAPRAVRARRRRACICRSSTSGRRAARSSADDYRRLGRLLTELGKRTGRSRRAARLPPSHEQHWASSREEVGAVLDAADRSTSRLLFDIAHYQQGGGDPVAAHSPATATGSKSCT